jgi:hypothetical protein
VRSSDSADEKHLTDFASTRRGVEGFVEPRTAVSDVTLMLVAHDGEWTRRRVPSVEWAHAFANRRGIPSYDAAVVGPRPFGRRIEPRRRRNRSRNPMSTSVAHGRPPDRDPVWTPARLVEG